MWRFERHVFLLLLPLMLQSCTAKDVPLKADKYAVLLQDETISEFESWFLNELTSRGNSSLARAVSEGVDNTEKYIAFVIDPDIEESFCIEHSENQLRIILKNEKMAKWMGYQLIEALSTEDSRFRSDDLPPASVKFQTHCEIFDFEYREPFFPTNLKEGNTFIYGNNSIDIDWGLWGHNLYKILELTSSMTAMDDSGERNDNQLCFSSSELFEQFSDYIVDNFGFGDEESYRFMVMPIDNDLVCLCESCVAIGNTEDNATPAVSYFLHKLSERFPNHQFFTSAYRTTRRPPKEPLPPNTGVFISTINLPQGTGLSEEQKAVTSFAKDVKDWKRITPHVYVWDYLSNFDDYFSPTPFLLALKERLRFFKEHKIEGVFLNGSGYDYSTFEDLNTYVASVLMRNINTDPEYLIKNYFRKFYRNYSKVLSDYYLQLEKDFSCNREGINIYGGTNNNLASFLNKTHFQKFYDRMKKADKEENQPENLQKLYIALNFVKLQIDYFDSANSKNFQAQKNKLLPLENISRLLSKVEQHKKYEDMTVYREEDGNLEELILFWKQEILAADLKNELLQEELNITFNNPNPNFLTDGLPGYQNDYHQGWFIFNKKVEFEWISHFSGPKTMYLRFLKNEKHRFDKPEHITLTINGNLVSTDFHENTTSRTREMSLPVSFTEGDKLKLQMTVKKDGKSKIALDEIRIK